MGRSERYLTRLVRQSVRALGHALSNPTQQQPTAVVGTGPVGTVACMTSTAECQEQRAAHERERAAVQNRIDELEEQRAALEGRIRWLTGKIDSGRRSASDAPGTAAKPVDLTAAIIDYVCSQGEPVSALDVMAHLRSTEVPFAEKSISGVIDRSPDSQGTQKRSSRTDDVGHPASVRRGRSSVAAVMSPSFQERSK